MDIYDDQAEQLLPCPTYKEVTICYDPAIGISRHARICPAWRRPAVAAALRELGKRADAEHDRAEWANKLYDGREAYLSKVNSEIADLRAVNRRLWESLTAEKRHELNVELQELGEIKHAREGDLERARDLLCDREQQLADLRKALDETLERKQAAIIERDELKALLAYSAPAVDHTCLAIETCDDDCRRCAIDRMLGKE